ncbi:hypothetical protein [Pedobacter nototheniae]|uniref:hypothetical protein n=1 Tax=Pedobacter nototheniae TaxID=2488994 RepID=UPI00292CC098|nr:hypothetical protein [Pedobacter nototheniae]
MISLDFLYDTDDGTQLYVLQQVEKKAVFKVFFNQDLIAEIDQGIAGWTQLSGNDLEPQLLIRIGEFINHQHYQKLPAEIKEHWFNYVAEAIATSDDFYLIITRPEIDFNRFEKTFKNYIANLVKDEWAITFRVCDAGFNHEFTLVING